MSQQITVYLTFDFETGGYNSDEFDEDFNCASNIIVNTIDDALGNLYRKYKIITEQEWK